MGYLKLLSKSATIAALFCCACDRIEPPPPPTPPEVTVASVLQKDVVPYLDFTGTTDAIEAVEVRARVRGFLERIEMEDSSFVKAGDVLFVIEPDEYQAALKKAEADLSSAEAMLQDAEWEFERMSSLVERDSAGKRELQDAITKRDLAKAEVAAANAALDRAALDLSYTEVKSPIDGRVSRRLKDVGTLVGAGENTLLTTVVKMDPMFVYFNIPERILLERLAERPVEERNEMSDAKFFVGLVHEAGYPHEGHLDYIDNTVDPDTGTLQIRGVVPNRQNLLFPGAFVRIRVPAREADANSLLVQERALGTDLGGKYVLVVGDDKVVEHRPVTLGIRTEDGMRVILDGLEAKERYIVNGLQRARPGLPVAPITETQANAQSRPTAAKPAAGKAPSEPSDS